MFQVQVRCSDVPQLCDAARFFWMFILPVTTFGRDQILAIRFNQFNDVPNFHA